MKQLRFTTTKPMPMLGVFRPKEDHEPLALPADVGELVKDTVKGKTAYIHGEAERLAMFDAPKFIDGNLGQLDLPIEEQDILMILPSGEYKCKAEHSMKLGLNGGYFLTLATEPSALN